MEILYLCTAAFLAGFTQGLTGFGSVLVSLPLMVLFLDIKAVVPLVSLLALCISTTLVVMLREHIQWRKIAPLLLAGIPGMAIGAYVLKHGQGRILELVIGTLLVVFPLYILTTSPRRRELASRWQWIAGFISGILGGSIGANGPPVIIYTSMQPWGKHLVKSTLVGYFLVAGIGISSIHAAYGLITTRVLKLFALGLLPVMAGVLTGSYLFAKMDSGAYRKVVLYLLLLLGVYMLVKTGPGTEF